VTGRHLDGENDNGEQGRGKILIGLKFYRARKHIDIKKK
jgi:hypothetical protein